MAPVIPASHMDLIAGPYFVVLTTITPDSPPQSAARTDDTDRASQLSEQGQPGRGIHMRSRCPSPSTLVEEEEAA